MRSFEKLYKAYSEQIYRYLLYVTANDHIAEELLQETFYQAFLSLYRFKGNAELKTWLYQIAKHCYFKHVKKEKKMDRNFQDFESIPDVDTPEKICEEKDINRQLRGAIGTLEEPYREVVILRLLNELKFKEIADIMENSENWAKVTFYRGKLKLREIIKKEL